MTGLLEDPATLSVCLLAFLVAGTIKGALGIGLPTTAMALLTLVMEPTSAMAVLVLPIVATNIMQYATTPHRLDTARRYPWTAATLVAVIFVTALFVSRVPDDFLVIAIGVVMCLFSMHALSGFSVPAGGGAPWQIGVGLAAGVCGGLSAIWSPPIVMYLLSRNVTRDEFVSACGFLFLAGSVPLGAGLILSGVVTGSTLWLSLACLAVTLASFRLGTVLRRRLANDTFRKLVLVSFFVFGARLVVTGMNG